MTDDEFAAAVWKAATTARSAGVPEDLIVSDATSVPRWYMNSLVAAACEKLNTVVVNGLLSPWYGPVNTGTVIRQRVTDDKIPDAIALLTAQLAATP